MKKIILSIALVFSFAYLKAQDETVINLFVQQKQYEKAKEQVDKWLADPKLKPKDKQTALLYKLLVYGNLYTDSLLHDKYPDANAQAMDAFNQYQAMDPALKQLKEQNFFASGIGNLYTGSFDRGKIFFQNKQWDSAFKYFSEAETLGNFLLANKLSTSTATIDTVTVLYTGFAAQNAKHLDTAAKYYAKLADIKVAGADYEDIYKFLVEYNSQQKNDTAFKKYLATAKELYPNDNSVWTQYEMSAMTSNASLPDLLKNYQQDLSAGSMNENKLVSYAAAFETNDSAQLKGLDSTQRIQLKLAAGQAYGKAFELDSSNGTYAFGAGYYDFVAFEVLDDRYHSYAGTSATLKAKRDEVAKQQAVYADSAAMWLEKAFAVLNAKQNREKSETANLNRTVNNLAIIYQWKRDRTKVDGNSKDYDKYDALYTKYDALYNTFK